MQILGIDTATLVCSVAVVSEEKTLAEYTQQVKKTHSERLLPLIAAVLQDAGLTPADLHGVAVAGGPGSFTGLRIGMVTAKALGQALNLPLIGVSTLEALAAQHPHFPGIISPILDARRSQVYNALFKPATPFDRLTEDRAVGLDELLAQLSVQSEHVLFTGDAVPLHRQAIEKKLGKQACFMPPEGSICRAATVARLGITALLDGQARSWRELTPQYIRRSEAERKAQALAGEGGVRCDSGD